VAVALAVCILITWLVICILSIIPKSLKDVDLIFIYFVNTIFELSVFTIFHINLRWINVGGRIDQSFADLVLRLIMIPLVFVISTQVLFYSIRIWKWVITGAIILLFILFSKLLEKFGILHLSSHWKVFYTFIMFCCYALLSWLMGWFMILLDKKEGEKA
jgi:hypothetical protein